MFWSNMMLWWTWNKTIVCYQSSHCVLIICLVKVHIITLTCAKCFMLLRAPIFVHLSLQFTKRLYSLLPIRYDQHWNYKVFVWWQQWEIIKPHPCHVSPHKHWTGSAPETALCSWWWTHRWSRGYRQTTPTQAGEHEDNNPIQIVMSFSVSSCFIFASINLPHLSLSRCLHRFITSFAAATECTQDVSFPSDIWKVSVWIMSG